MNLKFQFYLMSLKGQSEYESIKNSKNEQFSGSLEKMIFNVGFELTLYSYNVDFPLTLKSRFILVFP